MKENYLSKNGVSIGRLENLVKVINAGGVTAASKGDSNTQSLYSRQIKELEEAFDCDLFERDGRGRKPTRWALQLASIFSAFKASINDLMLEPFEPSVIKIGAGDSVYNWMLLPKFGVIQAKFPSISFELKNMRTSDVQRHVENGKIDIGIAEYRDRSSAIEDAILRHLEFGLFYHLESFANCVNVSDVLSHDKLIGLSGRGSYVRNCFLQQRNTGYTERFWLTFDSLPMVASSMVQSKASAFLPIEMRFELEELGFECIVDDSLSSFSRTYSLLISKKSAAIRRKVVEVSDAIQEMLE